MHANTWLTGNRSPPGFVGPAPARTPSGNFLICTKKPVTPWLRLSWHVISKPPVKIPKPPNGTSLLQNAFAARIGKPRRKKRRPDSAGKLPLSIQLIRQAIFARHHFPLPIPSLYQRRLLPPPNPNLWPLPRHPKQKPTRPPLCPPENPPIPLTKNTVAVAAEAVAIAERAKLPRARQRSLPPAPPNRQPQRRACLPEYSTNRPPDLRGPPRVARSPHSRSNRLANLAGQACAAVPAIPACPRDCHFSKCSFADC